jgi:hypothetical protein
MQVSDCEALRREIKVIADKVWQLRLLVPMDAPGSSTEVYANAMLAYRHLEDAGMRLGKAIQALNGGVSVYDKTQVPSSGGA